MNFVTTIKTNHGTVQYLLKKMHQLGHLSAGFITYFLDCLYTNTLDCLYTNTQFLVKVYLGSLLEKIFSEALRCNAWLHHV